MKISRKAVSSPGRVENYPPPLMRFLRSESNGGSRSRGRSRSSPMFIRQKKSSAAAAAVENQEPSSPKVTCMGQVRVRRSKQPDNRPGSTGKPKRRCKWIRDAFSCHPLASNVRTMSFNPRWRKWVSFSGISLRRNSKTEANSTRSEPGFGIEPGSVTENEREIEEDEEERENPKFSVSSVPTPPRNALLLTRSRSAPYRSSSLAYRFWGSPLTDQEEAKPETDALAREEDKEERPKSRGEPFSRESDQERRIDASTDRRIKEWCEFEGSIKVNDGRPVKLEEDGTKELSFEFIKPLILTRCKSEPARIGDNLEMGLWKKKKSL